MGKNNKVSKPDFNFTCFRCGGIIKPGEKMITISARLETPNKDGSKRLIESSGGSSVCSSCASFLSNENDILINKANDEIGKTTLNVHCSDAGFQFNLRCSDGISWANSQLYSWQQIVQLLIAANPEIFGVLDEPLHQLFPQNLKLLGYYVPNWQTLSG